MNPVQSILDRLSYQVRSPAITTCGPCSKGCGKTSRGGAVCWQCLIEELPEGMRGKARSWRIHQNRAQRTWWDLERMAEKAA